MEYHVVTSDTTAVGKQETEGSELSFGKVAFGTKTADINTYGGYTSLSRQTIERSTTPMLNTAITATAPLSANAPCQRYRSAMPTWPTPIWRGSI